MTKKQKEVKNIENITNPKQKIKIEDYVNRDIFVIERGDIKRFSYPEYSKNAYIDFVVPFADGQEIEYHTYSKRTPIIKSGETLHGFCIDKDVEIYVIAE